MATAGLVTFSVLSVGAAGLYLLIGAHAARTSPDGARVFRFWWWGLAGLALMTGLQGLFATLAGDASWVPVAAASTQFLYVLGACTALCGLMTYLWFLYTGSLRASPFLALFYGLVYVAGAASMAHQRVIGFAAYDYAVTVRYANPLPNGGVVYGVFYSLLLLPQILVAGLYLALYRRVGDREARVRVVLASASLLLLLVVTYAVGVTGHALDLWWLSGQQALTLLTSAGVLLAHRPPAWIGGPPRRDPFAPKA
ncbi:MAG: hypothetical protein QOE90_2427 [Thermoplasmata archaeon]|jgi:hypothetical protein|nr:hypothetical protein [Thermoplasmata archaeon]